MLVGEKATKWEEPGDHEVDGLTTNGILIMHPNGVFCPDPEKRPRPDPARPGIWREVSVSSCAD